jgi:hypothetical protein
MSNKKVEPLYAHKIPFQKKLNDLYYKDNKTKGFITPLETKDILLRYRKIIKNNNIESNIYSNLVNNNTNVDAIVDQNLSTYSTKQPIKILKHPKKTSHDKVRNSMILPKLTNKTAIVDIEERIFDNPIDAYDTIQHNKNNYKSIETNLLSKKYNKLNEYTSKVKNNLIDAQKKLQKIKITHMLIKHENEDKNEKKQDISSLGLSLPLHYTTDNTEFHGSYFYSHLRMPEGRSQHCICLDEENKYAYIFGGTMACKKNNIWKLNISKY